MMEPQINPVVNGMHFLSLVSLFLGISFVCVQFPQTQGIVVNMKKVAGATVPCRKCSRNPNLTQKREKTAASLSSCPQTPRLLLLLFHAQKNER